MPDAVEAGTLSALLDERCRSHVCGKARRLASRRVSGLPAHQSISSAVVVPRFTKAMGRAHLPYSRDRRFDLFKVTLNGSQVPVSMLLGGRMLFITLNREDFSFVIHLDRQPRTTEDGTAQTGSRARSGSRSERTLDAVEHSRTLMEWWPFLIFHRGGLRIKVINNSAHGGEGRSCDPSPTRRHCSRRR